MLASAVSIHDVKSRIFWKLVSDCYSSSVVSRHRSDDSCRSELWCQAVDQTWIPLEHLHLYHLISGLHPCRGVRHQECSTVFKASSLRRFVVMYKAFLTLCEIKTLLFWSHRDLSCTSKQDNNRTRKKTKPSMVEDIIECPFHPVGILLYLPHCPHLAHSLLYLRGLCVHLNTS